MKKVVILKIDNYDCGLLKDRIKKVLTEHFPLESYFCRQNKILLKPNLLLPALPQEAIVTHPLLIKAVGSIFREEGFSLAIADSPGGFVTMKDMDYVYDFCGVKKIAQEQGFELFYPDKSIICENVPLCWWADLKKNNLQMVNLPKLKTHDLAVLTLAVKNLYGCISGLHKSYMHKIHPRSKDFMKILIFLYNNIKPRLNIVDGILAMEGNGPAKRGTPRKLNIVVIGDDALYTDYVITGLLGLSEQANPLIVAARDLINNNDLEVISEMEEPVKNFRFPGTYIFDRIPSRFFPLIRLLLGFKPRVNANKCTGCGRCVKICPRKAIVIKQGKVRIDHKRCIMCMCCSEMCCYGAIDVDKSLVLRIIGKLCSNERSQKCTP